MTLRVAQINCVIDAHNRAPEALLQAWSTVSLVATAATQAGAEVTVLQSARTAANYDQAGVAYRFVAEPRLAPGYGSGLMPWRIAAELDRLRPDIVHFNGLDFPAHLRAACRGTAPVLVQDHASAPRSRGWRWRRWALNHAAAVAFTSAEQADPFRRARQLPRGLRVVEIAESSSWFTPGDREEARREIDVFGDPALLWVGHLDANKDPLTILRALSLALPRLPEAHLWCAFGTAPLMDEVRRLLGADPDLAQRVHLLGAVEHGRVEGLMRACDVFVSGSRSEGSGYALIEALACGASPVVSDIPAFRNLTGDGAVGALVPPGDPEVFARALEVQAALPRQAARAAVVAHFDRHLSPRALGKRLVEVYRDLAQRRRQG